LGEAFGVSVSGAAEQKPAGVVVDRDAVQGQARCLDVGFSLLVLRQDVGDVSGDG
jgi:hypothetical protein